MANTSDRSVWLEARQELLTAEKALQRARDELAARRRALPAYQLTEHYVLRGQGGDVTLLDLFAQHSQLLVYHFMYGPDWQEGCKSCSFWADSFDNAIPHLAARDTGFAVVSRAPLDQLLAYQKRMGWRFPWVSSADSTFNFDFNVSFGDQQVEQGRANYNYRDGAKVGSEMPGLSVFHRRGNGTIFHTYSTYSRGLDTLNPVYQLLDLLPDGRNEDDLTYPMDWVRRHDTY